MDAVTSICNDKHSSFWPASDVFFGYGVINLVPRLKKTSEKNEYLFINLNHHTIKSFFSDFSEFYSKRIIVISSRRLMPLAIVWLTEIENVCAVFESSVPVEQLVMALNSAPQNVKISFPQLRASDSVTLREALLLKFFLKTLS